MQDLKITLIQSSLFWEDKKANLHQFEEKIAAIEGTDIIVLPEMFNSGFSMKPELFSEEEPGQSLAWLQAMAALKQCAITGSIMVKEGENFFNRLYFVEPDGSFHTYDKRHLFRMGGEDLHYTPGQEKRIISYKGWKINFLVCYDLRFPVWSKNNFDGENYDYDLLLVTANWPAVRSRVWKTLLAARAIENQVYVVGLNRVGNDGNGLAHSGDSNVYDPKGIAMQSEVPNEEISRSFQISWEELKEFRAKFTVGLDWDTFSIDTQKKASKSDDKFSNRKAQTNYDG